jgi:hypothetical protein
MKKALNRGGLGGAKWQTILGVAALALAAEVSAQVFKNQFIQFNLPDTWECRVEGTEWVCQSSNPRIRKESIIIFAAKVAGDQDTLESYHSYLKTSRETQGLDDKPIKSEVTYARKKDIQGHTWIDAIHKNSEIPGFITRYLATTYQGIAILVTYSVLEPRYATYSNLFTRMIDSLKPLRDTGLGQVAGGPKTPVTSLSISDLISKVEEGPEAPPAGLADLASTSAPSEETGVGWGGLILIFVLGGALVGYMIYRRRKSQPPPASPEGTGVETGTEDMGEEAFEDEFKDDSEDSRNPKS